MAEVHFERRDNVAVLTLDRPVANALAPSLRADLLAGLDRAITDPDVQAVVLQGAGAGFSSGVDISEYDAPLKAPWVGDLCVRIENSPKPVVAALQGSLLGGGFELALAAHLRVATEGTRVALPEVTLGLTPGAGATQRLPRFVGAQASLELMLSGQTFEVSDPRLNTIIDVNVAEDPLETAIEQARALAAAGAWRRTRDRSSGLADPNAYQMAVSTVMGRLKDKNSAEADIVRCVEAALLLPFDRGLEFEASIFEDRRVTAKARARRHLFVAERRARILPERASGQAFQVQEVAILGSGALVVELAVTCLDAALRVAVVGAGPAEVETVRAQIVAIYDDAVAKERLSIAARDACLSNLTFEEASQALPRVDLVLDTGHVALPDGSAQPKPSVVWALLGDEAPALPASVGLADRVIGLRVYRPVFRSGLVELSVPPGANADAVVTLAELWSRMGRIVIRCAPSNGLVGNSLSAVFYKAALSLAEAGAVPYRIDVAARKLGFDAGPFAMMDREGLPQVLDRLNTWSAAAGRPPEAPSGLLNTRVEQGATGMSVGRGFYLYELQKGRPDPELPQFGTTLAMLSDGDVASALEAALVNQAARLLTDEVVMRASDIDLVMVRGYGFEQSKGGVLLQADLRGLSRVLKQLKRFEPVSEAIWTPLPMVEELVKNGEGFFGRVG